jgi:hypothetical protein
MRYLYPLVRAQEEEHKTPAFCRRFLFATPIGRAEPNEAAERSSKVLWTFDSEERGGAMAFAGVFYGF